eukprot:scaffold1453_cov112-Isochrysis_galbana.AAC.6
MPADHSRPHGSARRLSHQRLPDRGISRPRLLPRQLGPAPRFEARQPTSHGQRAGEAGRLWARALLRFPRPKVHRPGRHQMVSRP